MKYACILVLVTILARPAAAAEKYSLEDLQALADSKSWSELLAHGLDIPPSKRDPKWKGLIEKAATGRLESMQDEDLKWLDGTKGAIRDYEEAFTFLKDSKVYRRAADKTMVRSYRQCYLSRDCKTGTDVDWLQLVYAYAKSSKDPETACDAATMVTTFMVASAALPLFELATPSGKQSPCCQSDALKRAVKDAQKDASSKDDADELAKTCRLATK
jgi:hypothetical protein